MDVDLTSSLTGRLKRFQVALFVAPELGQQSVMPWDQPLRKHTVTHPIDSTGEKVGYTIPTFHLLGLEVRHHKNIILSFSTFWE